MTRGFNQIQPPIGKSNWIDQDDVTGQEELGGEIIVDRGTADFDTGRNTYDLSSDHENVIAILVRTWVKIVAAPGDDNIEYHVKIGLPKDTTLQSVADNSLTAPPAESDASDNVSTNNVQWASSFWIPTPQQKVDYDIAASGGNELNIRVSYGSYLTSLE